MDLFEVIKGDASPDNTKRGECFIAEKNYKVLKSEILSRRSLSYRIISIMSKNRLRILFFTLLGIVVAAFIVAALLANKGTFTITLPREQMINLGLVISDTPEFKRPRHEILAPPVVDMWNITRANIPDDVNLIDGEHSGENYFATTVYLKNMGDKDLDYTLAIDLNEMYNNLDEALRVELYVNDISTIYAKRKSDGSGNPEPDTVPFTARTRIISVDPREIKAGGVDKFTVVAWIEGEDVDCNNDLLGGFVKMTMSYDAKVKENNSINSE